MTKLVGILNITPDSFSDGGQFNGIDAATQRAEELFGIGIAFLDVGAESTRPNATPLSWYEEVDRLREFIAVVKERGWLISIDTHRPETAAWVCAQLPAVILNDVTGFTDPHMVKVAVESQKRIIVSHLPHNVGADIQKAHEQKQVDSLDQVVRELRERIDSLVSEGVQPENIIADPGIGFGKTPELNWELLDFAATMPEYPVMIGYSRKRFLGEHRMDPDPNIEAGQRAIDAGAAYLRVHDVAAHHELNIS